MTTDSLNALLVQAGSLFSIILLRQVAALVLAVLIATPVAARLAPLLTRFDARLVHLPWIIKFLTVIRMSLRPLFVWVLVGALGPLLGTMGWENAVLIWAAPLAGLWFYYRVLDTLAAVNFSSARATVWSRQILLPAALVVAVLVATGSLDALLNFGILSRADMHITVGSILAALVLLGILVALSRGVRQFLQNALLPGAGLDAVLSSSIATFAAYIIVTVGVISALGAIGIDLTTLTVIAGGLSVGIGFGMQEILSNFVSGIILMIERSIGPGHVIQVGGTEGVVQAIGVRSMTIKTRDNVELIVPNSRFLTDIVTNYTRADPLVRLRVSVGVTYSATPRTVEAALLEAAQHPGVLAQPAPSVQFRDFADSSLNFDLLVWTNEPIKIPALSSDLRFRIWDALQAHEIEIPFPQRDIHIRSVPEAWRAVDGRGLDVGERG